MDNDKYVTDKGGIRRNIFLRGRATEGGFAVDYALDHTLLAKSESGERAIATHGSKYAASRPYFNQDEDGRPVADRMTERRLAALEEAGADFVWNKDHTEFFGYVSATFKESPKAKSADGRPMLYIDESSAMVASRPFKATRFITAQKQWDKIDKIAALQQQYEDSLTDEVSYIAEVEAPEADVAEPSASMEFE